MAVLIVDDSPLVRQLLRHILESAGLDVIEAGDGHQALELVTHWRPEVITMDIHMPGLDGYQTTERIMQRQPTPILVVTGSSKLKEAQSAMRALDAGALAVLEKPRGPDHPDFERDAAAVAQAVLMARDVRFRDRWQGHLSPIEPWSGELRLLAIGASAGGPQALKTLLRSLHPACPWPILLVQHIAPGFLESFREWLGGHTRMPVHIAEDDQTALAGHIYLAPDGRHLVLGRELHLVLSDQPPVQGQRPAVTQLFASVREQLGARAVAILLSGMGRDGAEELLALRRQGALTLVQSPDTALINGMPGTAAALGGASQVLTPEQMALLLNTAMGLP
ncbi:MAG: response regulator [Gammaproteobacteria bacterium]|nr:response regulator [Gammaproteobacteria bacterium]